MTNTTPKPLALVVFLENIGHIQGLNLPQWVQNAIDYLTEEYAKVLLRLYGAYQRYDRVIILEDALATGPELAATLIKASRTHRVDTLLLVHGNQNCLIGHLGKQIVGQETFGPLLASYRRDPGLLDLRMVYGVNCYGVTLAPVWMALGAQVVNGAVGVNWLPEPSLSTFLHDWLQGKPYSQAVQKANQRANRWLSHVWKPDLAGNPHPFIASSRQTISGVRDITIWD